MVSEAALQVATKRELDLWHNGQVGNMERRTIDDGAGRDGPSHKRHAKIGRQARPERTQTGDRTEHIPLPDEQKDVVGSAESCGACDQGVEDGLHVSWGARNYAQDLTGRRLLFQCLAEFLE